MSLTVTSIGDNQQAPGILAQAYLPDQLIAGDLKIVSASVTITGGVDLKRGALLGKITASGKYQLSASAASDGSQAPVAVLLDDALCATSGGDVISGVALMGEFNSNAMTFGAGFTASTAAAACPVGLFIKIEASDLTATDPS